jgi:hypothetical protein
MRVELGAAVLISLWQENARAVARASFSLNGFSGYLHRDQCLHRWMPSERLS